MRRNAPRPLGAIVLLGAGLLSAAACGSGEKARDDEMAAAVDAMSRPPAPDTLGAPTLTDANIVAILDGANMADSSMGALAERRTKNTDVKTFARMMMGEHHALRAAGRDLAAKLGVTPQLPAGDESAAQHQAAVKRLQAAADADFDRLYLAHEVEYHEAVLSTATAARAATKDPELQALLDTAAPVVQKHLDEARRLQTKLGR